MYKALYMSGNSVVVVVVVIYKNFNVFVFEVFHVKLGILTYYDFVINFFRNNYFSQK